MRRPTVYLLLENLESIMEGMLIFVMFVMAGLVVGVGMALREITDAWWVHFKLKR